MEEEAISANGRLQLVPLLFSAHFFAQDRPSYNIHFVDVKKLTNWLRRPTDSSMTVAEKTAVDAADDSLDQVNKTSGTHLRLQPHKY